MSTTLLTDAIRDIPDFPKPGIVFKDITPILQNPKAYRTFIDLLVAEYKDKQLDAIVAVDARGFLFGGALAYQIGVSLVPVRKKGKLPFNTHEISYELEYGTATLEIHADAFSSGDRVLIIDDLLATGGTVEATIRLCKTLGAEVVGCAFLLELSFLGGRNRLDGVPVFVPIVV